MSGLKFMRHDQWQNALFLHWRISEDDVFTDPTTGDSMKVLDALKQNIPGRYSLDMRGDERDFM